MGSDQWKLVLDMETASVRFVSRGTMPSARSVFAEGSPRPPHIEAKSCRKSETYGRTYGQNDYPQTKL
jgi:hypothetical protein